MVVLLYDWRRGRCVLHYLNDLVAHIFLLYLQVHQYNQVWEKAINFI